MILFHSHCLSIKYLLMRCACLYMIKYVYSSICYSNTSVKLLYNSIMSL